ncbi:glycine cleavage system aminomethyltransferase GcvT, partial [bacterium]|nr:glycine cleavage system aminomethyltransferase GcvT [bacterium]
DKEFYIGKDVVEKELAEGTPRKLVGLQLTTKQSGRNGQNVMSGDKIVGTVTSGSLAPSLGYAIAFAYVDKDFCEVGTKLAIDNGRKLLEAEVVPTPFYKEGTARKKTTA